ncbi:MAG: sulfate permease [Synechococcales cyanobacterium T60_A2020_003]|nr:sulfate permease [Synechococcales cyanobacterium T60_A2020_003]
MSVEHSSPQKSPSRLSVLKKAIPILEWGFPYPRANAVGDITAGIIVASLLIPQSMAYALLAGLPPQMGLYASILPQIIYACLGTSRILSVAPVAVDSLMVATAVGALATQGSPEYIQLAIALAALVGGIEVVIGLLRLGFLVNFLSQAVISGFISAAAILISVSQLKHLLGVKIPQSEALVQLVTSLIQALPETNGITLLMGLGSIALLLFFSRGLGGWLQQRGMSPAAIIPVTKSAPLLVVILGILTVWLFHLDQTASVKVVGSIPSGLPPIGFPAISRTDWQTLFSSALAISFVGFMEAYAVGKFLASKRRQRVEANQELIALGVANLGASFTGGYVVTGGLSRSVVNFSAGANTGLASIITALILLLTILFLTPLFYFLPQTCLAAIILVAVVNLLDFATLKRLWIYNKTDAIAWIAAFVAVLVTSVQTGILIGAVISLMLHLWRTSRPHIAIVGRVGETEHFRNVLRHSVKTCPHVLAIRVDESLYFVNTKYLEDYVLKAISQNPDVKYLLLVCSAINIIDGSALETLRRLIADLQVRGITFCMAEVKGPVMDHLEQIGFVDELGRDRIFLSTDQAMRALECA